MGREKTPVRAELGPVLSHCLQFLILCGLRHEEKEREGREKILNITTDRVSNAKRLEETATKKHRKTDLISAHLELTRYFAKQNRLKFIELIKHK